MKESVYPLEIKLDVSKTNLSILFNNKKRYSISSELLRIESPSAEVRGHNKDQKKIVHNKKNVEINKIEPIGNYAIAIDFNDGHNTGIYSWNFLYDLMENKDAIWKNYLKNIKKENLKR